MERLFPENIDFSLVGTEYLRSQDQAASFGYLKMSSSNVFARAAN